MALCPPAGIRQLNQSGFTCFCYVCSPRFWPSVRSNSQRCSIKVFWFHEDAHVMEDQERRQGALCARCPASDVYILFISVPQLPLICKTEKDNPSWRLQEKARWNCMGHCVLSKVLKTQQSHESSRGPKKRIFFFLSLPVNLRPFAVRTATAERQEEAVTGNQDACGIRAIPWLPGLRWSVAYK